MRQECQLGWLNLPHSPAAKHRVVTFQIMLTVSLVSLCLVFDVMQ